ncbi:FAD:protein FMN transferase [Thalassococcus sp. CAU 1522]|uniref:FAD:protein FMN transferase n=1 Tax=Thalassococcus arenae TaxID=2851652 RepID=A0ABS6NC39_9RHOB|nr:FAD:protein FMN transferase [Thalassococcus arenae]MBV2361586.1 FAD:protein FMN transferase [Thalassococcus arenae]
MLTKRRFLAISAACGLFPFSTQAVPLHVETGVALGARVSLRLSHPDAARIARGALSEIARLEGIFSLYRPDSALSRLNADAQLAAPPPELLECLSIADAVHAASGGLFDPTVQTLWRAHADATERGETLSPQARSIALARTGWKRIRLAPDLVAMQPGMQITLNGIAQGYIADRIADWLTDRGLSNILIDTGEIFALGGEPDTGNPWPVRLEQGGQVGLKARALATSAPLGMTFGGNQTSAHILDPRTGDSVPLHWRAISISSRSAALADALSTGACIMGTRAEIAALCASFADTKVESARRATG